MLSLESVVVARAVALHLVERLLLLKDHGLGYQILIGTHAQTFQWQVVQLVVVLVCFHVETELRRLIEV